MWNAHEGTGFGGDAWCWPLKDGLVHCCVAVHCVDASRRGPAPLTGPESSTASIFYPRDGNHWALRALPLKWHLDTYGRNFYNVTSTHGFHWRQLTLRANLYQLTEVAWSVQNRTLPGDQTSQVTALRGPVGGLKIGWQNIIRPLSIFKSVRFDYHYEFHCVICGNINIWLLPEDLVYIQGYWQWTPSLPQELQSCRTRLRKNSGTYHFGYWYKIIKTEAKRNCHIVLLYVSFCNLFVPRQLLYF